MHTAHLISAILFLLIVASAYAVYSPPGFALDMWFIKEKGLWHQFELNGPHPSDWDKQWPPLDQADRPPLAWFEQGIFHSTSKDLITWHDEGVAVTIGKPGEWDDGKIASGNIVKREGTFYLFYPGIREHPRPGECATPIGVATSKDMVHWTKHPDNPVMVPDGKIYDPAGNWRDCSFLWDEKQRIWYTVVCATATGAGPIESRGCIALLRSADLIHWEALPPLVISDRYTLGMELPFLFKHGKKWYLGHSMYGNYFSKDWLAKHPEVEARGGVHYFIGDSMFGPFAIPEDDCLGCQPDPPPYAVQLIDEGGDKLFMHWGPIRYATALPKKVEFLPSDLMRLVYWKGTEKARKESLAGGDSNRRYNLDADALPSADIGTPATDCFFEGTVSGDGTVGFALGSALLVSVDVSAGVVKSLNPADRTPREGREGKVSPDGPMRLKLVADGSVVDVYANDIWMFSEHCGRPDPDQARLIALSGKVTVDKVRLDRLATGNPIHRYGFNY
ncbi:MAG: hypothetical protein KBC96_14940 [Armatimonadetes bacterium]|nr:hypothetical protein [Armatimonadota bacterium]